MQNKAMKMEIAGGADYLPAIVACNGRSKEKD